MISDGGGTMESGDVVNRLQLGNKTTDLTGNIIGSVATPIANDWSWIKNTIPFPCSKCGSFNPYENPHCKYFNVTYTECQMCNDYFKMICKKAPSPSEAKEVITNIINLYKDREKNLRNKNKDLFSEEDYNT